MLQMGRANTRTLGLPGEMESLLVADFGSGTTRAVLLERIAGSWRYVGQAISPTTLDLPEQDLCAGWLDAVRDLGRRVGRQLLDRDGILTPQQPRGDGVDAILAVSSLGNPIRIALLDTAVSQITTAIIDALRDTYCRVLHATAPNTRKDGGWPASRAADLRIFNPEQIILLLESSESHAVTHALAALGEAGGTLRPVDAIISGKQETMAEARGLFGSATRVICLKEAARSESDLPEKLQHDVQQRWHKQLSREDIADAFAASLLPPVPRTAAVDLATQKLAQERDAQVASVAIDEGSHLHIATPDDRYQLTFPDLDVRGGLSELSSEEVTQAGRWLPFGASDDDLLTWVLNRVTRPWTDLITERDVHIEQALARQVLRRLARSPRLPGKPSLAASELLILTGELSSSSLPAVALAVIDGLALVPERGSMALARDTGALMMAAGVASLIDPDITSDVLSHDSLLPLGSLVVLTGTGKRDATAAQLEIERDGEAIERVLVPAGELLVLPLAHDQTAKLAIKPGKKYRVGTLSAGKPAVLGHDKPLIGGSIGLIVDARNQTVAPENPITPNDMARWLDAIQGTNQ